MSDHCPQKFLAAVETEILRARALHPGHTNMLAALVEEVGELAKALLEHDTPERIHEEAVHVACVAARIATEGDTAFDRPFTHVNMGLSKREGGKRLWKNVRALIPGDFDRTDSKEFHTRVWNYVHEIHHGWSLEGYCPSPDIGHPEKEIQP